MTQKTQCLIQNINVCANALFDKFAKMHTMIRVNVRRMDHLGFFHLVADKGKRKTHRCQHPVGKHRH